MAGIRTSSRAAGFTLVEVLVAAVILFMVLALATLAYRAALVAGERATRTAELLAPLPWIVPTIRDRLLDTPAETLEGAGEMLGVRYEFVATSIRFASAPERFDPDFGEFLTPPPRFRLYDVTLTLGREGDSRSFLYQELAWLPRVP